MLTFDFSECFTPRKILQACLNHDPRLLTEETWKLAVTDQTTPLGVKHSGWKTTMPDLSREWVVHILVLLWQKFSKLFIDLLSLLLTLHSPASTNSQLKQRSTTLESTFYKLKFPNLLLFLEEVKDLMPGQVSIRKVFSLQRMSTTDLSFFDSASGLFNVYWFVDPNKGVGGMIGGQLLVCSPTRG